MHTAVIFNPTAQLGHAAVISSPKSNSIYLLAQSNVRRCHPGDQSHTYGYIPECSAVLVQKKRSTLWDPHGNQSNQGRYCFEGLKVFQILTIRQGIFHPKFSLINCGAHKIQINVTIGLVAIQLVCVVQTNRRRDREGPRVVEGEIDHTSCKAPFLMEQVLV